MAEVVELVKDVPGGVLAEPDRPVTQRLNNLFHRHNVTTITLHMDAHRETI